MEQVIKNVAEVIKDDVIINSSALACDVVDETFDNVLRNYEGIKDFIDCALGSQQETDMKKLFSKAIIVAQDQGVLPPALAGLPRDAVAIASLVDESLTRIKTAAMVEAEKLYPEKAINEIIDHTAIRLKVVSDVVIEKGINTVTETAIQTVSCVFPPIQIVAPAIREFTKRMTPTIQRVVKKGIDVVSSTAKSIVKTIGTRAIKNVQKVGRKILSFLGL